MLSAAVNSLLERTFKESIWKIKAGAIKGELCPLSQHCSLGQGQTEGTFRVRGVKERIN